MKQLPKCPYCSASHWIELYSTSTLIYSPIEYINGKVSALNDPNFTCIHVRCLECHQVFAVLKKNGEYI